MDAELLDQGYTTTNNIYNFILNFITENGYSPSFREIADGTGIKSSSTVKNHLAVLERLGIIHTKEFQPRTISLTGYKFVKETEE